MARVDGVKPNSAGIHKQDERDSSLVGAVALVAVAVFGYCCFNVAKQLVAGLQLVVPITR